MCLLEAAFKPFVPAAKRKRALGHEKYVHGKSPLPDCIDAIIIGSGMAGLSCAATLAQMGYKVVVFEAHEVAGGGTHCFAVDGKSKWKFDSGLHYVVGYVQHLLQVACGAAAPPVRIIRMGEESDLGGGVYDTVTLGPAKGAPPVEKGRGGPANADLGIVSDVQMAAELKRQFPAHAGAIDAYVSLCHTVLLRFPVWAGSALLPFPLRKRVLASRFMKPWQTWAKKTAQEGLTELFPGADEDSGRLKALLCGLWIDSGCPPTRGSFFMQVSDSGL
jgi:all-trans-retinol 13,14-reductase